MPRPLSETVTVRPSLCSVTRDLRGVPVHRLVNRVVDDLPDQVMQSRHADTADIHPGTLADRLESLQDGDVLPLSYFCRCRSHGILCR